MPMIPTVKDISPRGERYFDLFSKLLGDRVIVITEAIDDHMMGVIVSQLLYLEAMDSEEPIHMYISSPGGSVMSGLAILDTMNLINAPVYTYAMGMVASMAAVLFTCGDKGHRYMLPNAEVMIHQPWGGIEGQATDIAITAKHILKTRENLNKILAKNTGKPLAQVEKDTERDFYMSAEEAKKYGIVDDIYRPKNPR